MISKIMEYGFALGFPLLVFILSLNLYPVGYDEARILSDEESFPGYVPTLVVASGYMGWQHDYGIVESVSVVDEGALYMINVRVDDRMVKVIALNPSVKLDVDRLKGSQITFYGPIVEIRGEKVVLARVLVVGDMDMHGVHHAMCVYKGDFSKMCDEMMEKHREMMEKMYGRRSRG